MTRSLAAAAILISLAGCRKVDLGIGVPEIESNVRRADYVGADACGECHGTQYRQWSGNLHRAMNRPSSDAEAIVGDFSGVTIRYAGGEARFHRDQSDNHLMTLRSAAGATETYRVTRTIGRRYIQEYVGVLEGEDTEVRLPFGYWRRQKQWYHQQYFDSWFDDEYANGKPAIDAYRVDPTPWATRCAWCHNTYPFELRVARSQAPKPIGEGIERVFELANAPTVSGNLLPLDSLVSVGISCESCHFGGRDHTEGARIAFAPKGIGLRSTRPIKGERSDAETINLICAQCHSAPSRKWPSGASKRNSREALDLLGGACSSAIKCTDCHDPHPKGQPAGQPAAAEHISACLGCHPKFKNEKTRAAHSLHDTSVTCLDCHMPRIVQGFSDQLRSHRITSPTATQVLDGAEPDACGLCHLERSSRQLALDLSTGWGQRPRPRANADEKWERDIDLPIGERWLASKSPIIRVTAAAAYGSKPRAPAIAKRLVEILDDPIAYYRMRVLFALQDVLGREIEAGEYDPTAPPAERARGQRDLAKAIR